MAEIEFFGVRGSLPTPLSPMQIRGKIKSLLSDIKPENLKDEASLDQFLDQQFPYFSGTVGGNSACVRMHFNMSPNIICDAGSGIRTLGEQLLKEKKSSKEIYIFISHTHWDHIMGFPFFSPCYLEDYQINIMGCHSELEERFRQQQSKTHFPVPLDDMKASIKFIELETGKNYKLGNLKVTPVALEHPGDSYAYLFDDGMKKVIYSTDSNYGCVDKVGEKAQYLCFEGANAMIYDAMYSFDDYMDKMDWGHSSSLIGVDFAIREKINHLILFHHEPNYEDSTLQRVYEETLAYLAQNYPKSNLKVSMAIEGSKIII